MKTTSLHHLVSITEIDNIHWLAFDNGVARINMRKLMPLKKPTALIRKVHYRNTQESLYTAALSNKISTLDVDYQDKLLRFQFALTDYEQEGNTLYRYRINAKEWSLWSDKNFVDIANLWRGKYRFEMQARDNYDRVISSTPIEINVNPAWFMSHFAFFVYLIGFSLLLFMLAKLISRKQTKKLEQEKQKLETIVTERTKKIRQQTEKLEAMDQAKSRFFANVSHEFRTPLTLTMGPMEEILRLNSLDKNIKTYADMALRNARKMMGLLSQILDINRLEAGRAETRASEYDLANTCRNQLTNIAIQAEKQGITLREVGLDDPVLVYFDYDHMDKIITNLLSNALKFTPPGGTISLALEPLEHSVILSVKDNGKGISKVDQEKIFDRYFQAKDNHNPLQPGTGIGLALVKELVELHHTTINVDSTPDLGSEFTIELRRGKEHFTQKELLDTQTPFLVERSATESKTVTNNNSEIDSANLTENSQDVEVANQYLKTILIADDNSELREFIRLRLNESYKIIEAEDGAEALKLTKELLPDLIVSDVMMPNMTGLEFASQMKKDAEISHIPLILLTARSTKRDIVEGLQGGANDYLTKPFDTSELSARISGLLTQQERLKIWVKNNIDIKLEATKEESTEITKNGAFKEKFSQYINKQLSNNSLTIENMAESLHMQRTTLFRKVKKEFQCSPQQFLKKARLEYAAKLLKTNKGSVSEIAYAVGFSNFSHFSRSFTNLYNVSPSVYLSQADTT